MKYVIHEHIPLETARKDVCHGTGEPYTGELDQVSEWAMAFALANFEVGEVVEEGAIADAIQNAIVQQTLDGLAEDGIVETLWDDVTGEPVYRLSEEGRKRVEDMEK